MSTPIQPLRIQKTSIGSSPSKMTLNRPLSEIGPSERRRNSPSFNQTTKNMLFHNDSSPIGSSPASKNSSRIYWQNRDSGSPTRGNIENNDPLADLPSSNMSPVKRSSIEKLKRASRVKNSNIFAMEQQQDYDLGLNHPMERPPVTTRPLSAQVSGIVGNLLRTHSPTKVQTDILTDSASKSSPSKSSLTKRHPQVPQLENGEWSDDEEGLSRQLPPGRTLRRHAKSVTFDAAPPQVNEYEMTTPVPSSIASESREGSHDSYEDCDSDEYEQENAIDADDSFDASLEDTEKTPVVLPDDWRYMSPTGDGAVIVNNASDPFKRPQTSPAPSAQPSKAERSRSSPIRTESAGSDGIYRPLPPLPYSSKQSSPLPSPTIRGGVSAMAERNSPSPRQHTPQPAQISKSDIQRIGSTSMSLEERLKLMMVKDERTEYTTNDQAGQEEPSTKSDPRTNHLDEVDENDDLAVDNEYLNGNLPPQISRESILQSIQSQPCESEVEDEESSFLGSSNFHHDVLNIDPDVALPTTESEEPEIMIKTESDGESEVDVYAIPDLYREQQHAQSFLTAMDKLEAIKNDRQAQVGREDELSNYSGASKHDDPEQPMLEQNDLPLLESLSNQSASSQHEPGLCQNVSLPQFKGLGENDFDFDVDSFVSDKRSDAYGHPGKAELDTSELQAREEQPSTPQRRESADENSLDAPSSPESVIRHVVMQEVIAPEIPTSSATIKAPGSRLKTRPSATPADMRAMAEARRQISSDFGTNNKPFEKALGRPSLITESPDTEHSESFDQNAETLESTRSPPTFSRRKKSSLVSLDLHVGNEPGLGIEMERLIEAQKKGYLTRQNTKLIVASSASHESAHDDLEINTAIRGTKSAGSSPTKAHAWTTEPWNGRTRRKSIRKSGGPGAFAKSNGGPAPPLPGLPSNISSGLESVAENEAVENAMDVGEDGERGRLFVKVVRVKDLELPLPKGERSYFALTLDNGLHCVTTSWIELGKTAPIGQEFELVVLDDLEFQLTLQTKIEEPKVPALQDSPTKASKSLKASTFSRVFASPKKRKEMELKSKQEQAVSRQRAASPSKAQAPPTAWELLHNVVGKDGSFARSYVCLKDHESKAYGQQLTVEVPCFNEWAVEQTLDGSSARSKRTGQVQHRPPYCIGKLELQLLYVPKPKGATDEDMPKSMNACLRELKELESVSANKWEGYLSQQGGDCPYWRRRYFSLDGAKFTAYHEATHQPRATINLAKASKLIDDKSSLMKPGSANRRRSAFADEDAGYMFVEEGFRIRFANGETIDFYADSAAEKDGWMKALLDVVGKEVKSNSWTSLVLSKRKANAMRVQHAGEGKIGRTPSKASTGSKSSNGSTSRPSGIGSTARSAPSSPTKQPIAARHQPAVTIPQKSPRRSDASGKLSYGGRSGVAAAKTRSMIF